MTVANTILEQLGSNKFIAMTGAKNFLSDGNTLRMTLPKNRSKAHLTQRILTQCISSSLLPGG